MLEILFSILQIAFDISVIVYILKLRKERKTKGE